MDIHGGGSVLADNPLSYYYLHLPDEVFLVLKLFIHAYQYCKGYL